MKKGEVNREFLELFLLNVRIPEQNWGDLRALLVGLATAERRMNDLVARYGISEVQDGIGRVLDYAEAEARSIISRAPDGTYTFWDYMEGDQFGGGIVRIKLHLTIQGSDLHLDFSETDPQVRFAINMPTHSQPGHYMLAFGVVNWLRTTAPEITYNSGLVRPVHLVVPEGNLLNPDESAAVGVRAATMFRVADVIAGALAQALPEEIPAAGSGQGSILLIATPDTATGKTKVSVVQPLAGGSGARPTKDGIDGIDFLMGYLRNIPTEVIEAEMPGVMVLRYALRPDSAGPGRWRGGTGIELTLQVFPAYATITNRGMERYIFRPWGRLGGGAGDKGRTLLNPGTEREQDIGKIDVLPLEPGDVLYLATQGGGGYGNPLARDPARVRDDVINGLVSVSQACDIYGVILHNGTVSEAATLRQREKLEHQQQSGGSFGWGPERLAYEARWPDSLQTALNEAVAPSPIALRSFLRDRAVRLAEARAERGERISVPILQELVAEVRHSLTQHR
jgi:N-methylhydantoinase B